MNTNWVLYSGLTLALIGALGVVGIVPLGAISSSTITFGTPTVTCATNACTASVAVTNNGQTTSFSIYFKVSNSLGQTVSIQNQPAQSTPTTFTATQTLPNLGSGTYTLSVFAVDLLGNGISTTATATFNTGQFTLTMNPTTYGTTTPPAGSTLVNAGSSVTLSFTPISGYTFTSFFIACDNNPNNPITGSTNPYTFTINGNCEVTIQIGYPVNTITITPTIFGQTTPPQGSISPSSAQTVYASSSAGATSVTFTETPSTGYSFVQWQVYGTNPPITGTSPSITLTYTQLQSAGILTSAQLVATFTNQPTLTIAANGVTTNPAPGNYPYPVGQTVTITEATPSGSCFLGWLVTQGSGTVQNLGKSPALVITIVQGANSVLADGAPATDPRCNAGPGSNGTPVLSWALLIGGIALSGYGAVRRKAE